MCSISTRLDALTRQLTIISKLQRMEEESNAYPHLTCKKYSMQNNFAKHCHCAYHVLSLKEQCNRVNCVDECFSYESCKKKSPCNARTCRARKKCLECRGTKLSEVQTDLKVSKSAGVNMSSDAIREDPAKGVQTRPDQLPIAQLSGSYVSDKIRREDPAKGVQTRPDQLPIAQLSGSYVSDKIRREDPAKGVQTRPDQLSIAQLSGSYVSDKMISTHAEMSDETIPTKDTSPTDLSVKTSSMKNVQLETAASGERNQSGVDVAQGINESGEVNYSRDGVQGSPPVADKKMFERIQEDLSNERKRTEELEKKLESLTCSLNCLKEDGEQRAACLKGALETAEQQTKFAMNLTKRSENQSHLVKVDRDGLLDEVTKLQQQISEVEQANKALTQERDKLKNKMQSLWDDESKRCEEVEKEVSRMKSAVKEKEDALNKERTELMNMISELTNVIKIQKRRICEVTGLCNNQQRVLDEKDEELTRKSSELSQVQGMLQSSDCASLEMKEAIEGLKRCLCEEKEACKCLQKELEDLQENHSSELRIKEKILEEQNRTIARQRKLLNDSEGIAEQAAVEFDQLKEDLYQEKQRSKTLQVTLDQTDKLNKARLVECDQCRVLRSEIEYLKKEKQRALTIAKFAYQKLNGTVKDYQKQLTHEKQQHRHMASVIQTKEEEIGYLRTQMYQSSSRTVKKMNMNYVT